MIRVRRLVAITCAAAAFLAAVGGAWVGGPTAPAAAVAGSSSTGVRSSGSDPFGQVDQVSVEPGTVTARGWAIDPDSAAAILVQVYLDARSHVVTRAGTARPDVGSAHPWAGPDHGYSAALPAEPGAHRVCVYAINVGPGASTRLGCTTVSVPGHDPVGRVDRWIVEPGRVGAAGWAADADAAGPVLVQMYVDSRDPVLARAGAARPDVATVYPWAGPDRGYTLDKDVTPGPHRVCVFAVNTGPGTSRELGCRRVQVPGHDPFGQVDAVTASGGTVTATGWAIDADAPSSPVLVQMYVDFRDNAATWANATRSDVGAVHAWAGPGHGYALSMSVPPGLHTVCLYAINVGPGSSRQLGCRRVPGPPFFVYGSLRTGGSAHTLLAGRTTREVLTRMPGLDLYRRAGSSFPYAVPNPANAAGLVGEATAVHPDHYPRTLADLDRYERYDPAQPPDNQVYVRELRPTREGVPSWVYVAGPRQAQYLRSSGILVTSGDFLRW
jgi:gamma-glutamylcyclotransferase (GGCT)/AIG2-like uncharacterized protein YtfP